MAVPAPLSEWKLPSYSLYDSLQAAGSVSGQPRVNATPSKAQRLDHNFRVLASLASFHGANPNLFQRLVVKSTSVAALHASLYSVEYYRIHIEVRRTARRVDHDFIEYSNAR